MSTHPERVFEIVLQAYLPHKDSAEPWSMFFDRIGKVTEACLKESRRVLAKSSQ